MVPDNIIWAFYSASDYRAQAELAKYANRPEPKDVYYQNIKGEWVKVTAVFDCIDKARKDYNHDDVIYLGAVLKTTKGEIGRGLHYPPVTEDKKTAVEKRKEQIRSRLVSKYGKIQVKVPSNDLMTSYWNAMDKYSNDVWDR